MAPLEWTNFNVCVTVALPACANMVLGMEILLTADGPLVFLTCVLENYVSMPPVILVILGLNWNDPPNMADPILLIPLNLDSVLIVFTKLPTDRLVLLINISRALRRTRRATTDVTIGDELRDLLNRMKSALRPGPDSLNTPRHASRLNWSPLLLDARLAYVSCSVLRRVVVTSLPLLGDILWTGLKRRSFGLALVDTVNCLMFPTIYLVS